MTAPTTVSLWRRLHAAADRVHAVPGHRLVHVGVVVDRLERLLDDDPDDDRDVWAH